MRNKIAATANPTEANICKSICHSVGIHFPAPNHMAGAAISKTRIIIILKNLLITTVLPFLFKFRIIRKVLADFNPPPATDLVKLVEKIRRKVRLPYFGRDGS